jgi:hypothetical protein
MIPAMAGIDREALRALIQAKGKTPRQVSLEITDGRNGYLVREILSGKSQNPRRDTLAKIAKSLAVSVDQIASGADDEEGFAGGDPEQARSRFLPVRYQVAAGVWFENEIEEPPVEGIFPVAPDPRYAAIPQWLEVVRGNSANLKIPDGHFAHVIDAEAMGYVPQDKHWVVLERTRVGGRLRERTIKQVEVTDDGQVLFWGRSTEERWNKPITLNGGTEGEEDVEVRVAGLVRGAYDPDF